MRTVSGSFRCSQWLLVTAKIQEECVCLEHVQQRELNPSVWWLCLEPAGAWPALCSASITGLLQNLHQVKGNCERVEGGCHPGGQCSWMLGIPEQLRSSPLSDWHKQRPFWPLEIGWMQPCDPSKHLPILLQCAHTHTETHTWMQTYSAFYILIICVPDSNLDNLTEKSISSPILLREGMTCPSSQGR